MSNASVSHMLLDAGVEWSPTAFAAAINHGNNETVDQLALVAGLTPPDRNCSTAPDRAAPRSHHTVNQTFQAQGSYIP